ncbi:MAG: S41 family peptidase [Anaerolineae bacterium]
MQKRYVVGLAVFLGLTILSAYAAGFVTHWVLSDHGYLVHMRLDLPLPGSSMPDERERFALFWEAWEILKKDYYGELPQGQAMPYAAIRGVLNVLGDPYTLLVEPSPREIEKDTLRGSFGGIGAWVSQREDGAIVLSPIRDRPAYLAGIREGDVVVAVDGVSVAGMSTDEVVALIRGPVGSMVRITVRRDETGEELEFSVRREKIETPTVQWRMVEGTTDVGYIQMALLGERTEDELEKAITELQKAGATRLILDLRGNPGGLLDVSVQVASQFLDGGPVLYERRKNGSERAYLAKQGGLATDARLVVLVDGGTASGAEIIAGALQARKRALLVGERTYGKGAVQNVYDLSDGSSLHVTVAKLFTPDMRLIDKNGLEPDEEVPFPPEAQARGEDPQLQKALELLQSPAQARRSSGPAVLVPA